eukprot:5773367-Pleurochrysis_carterae.AAC.2
MGSCTSAIRSGTFSFENVPTLRVDELTVASERRRVESQLDLFETTDRQRAPRSVLVASPSTRTSHRPCDPAPRAFAECLRGRRSPLLRHARRARERGRARSPARRCAALPARPASASDAAAPTRAPTPQSPLRSATRAEPMKRCARWRPKPSRAPRQARSPSPQSDNCRSPQGQHRCPSVTSSDSHARRLRQHLLADRRRSAQAVYLPQRRSLVRFLRQRAQTAYTAQVMLVPGQNSHRCRLGTGRHHQLHRLPRY